MNESEAREAIGIRCQEVLSKVFLAAGELIAQSVMANGNNYQAIYEDARAIVNAVSMELTYFRRG